jgi:hypothetical protein
MDFLSRALVALLQVASSYPALAGYALVIVVWAMIAWKVQRNKLLLANLSKLPPQAS